MPSKAFGPTDSAADTMTQIGSTYQMPPGNWVIDKITVGKGNVVNAAGNAGFLRIETIDRDFYFAYGNGSGGATNGVNIPAEKIDAAISVEGNTDLKIHVLDATAAKDVVVSVHFILGSGKNNFRTYGGGGVSANGDTAADTAEYFTVSAKATKMTLTPVADGFIKQIRFAGSGVVDAKANTAILTIELADEKYPQEFAVGSGPGGAATSSSSHADVIDIPEGIKITKASTIAIKIQSAEAMKFPHVSLSCF